MKLIVFIKQLCMHHTNHFTCSVMCYAIVMMTWILKGFHYKAFVFF